MLFDRWLSQLEADHAEHKRQIAATAEMVERALAAQPHDPVEIEQ